jgi:hypothetical protein
MMALNLARDRGRHCRRARGGLIFWLAIADVALFVLCVIAGGVLG